MLAGAKFLSHSSREKSLSADQGHQEKDSKSRLEKKMKIKVDHQNLPWLIEYA
jgi:hypothetical protein